MSESLRNDGRIWVPKKIEDAKALQAGTKKGSDIPEEDRDYYLERRYPAFGNLVPRDVASRAAKERCDKGFGVNNTGLAVFLDFSESIERLGIDIVRQRYGNLFDMYEEITDVNPGELANEINGVKYYNPMMIFPAIHYTVILQLPCLKNFTTELFHVKRFRSFRDFKDFKVPKAVC